MQPFQLLLALFLFGTLVLFVRRLSGRIFLKLVVAAIILCGIVFTLFPQLTQLLADLMGIGRGADLVIYTCLTGLLTTTLLLYLRCMRLEKMITELARKIALKEE